MSTHAQAAAGPSLAPAEVFARLARRAGVFWLDSSLPRAQDGRYSIIGAEPRWVFTTRDGQWEIRHHDGRIERGGRGVADAPARPTTHNAADATALRSPDSPLEKLDELLSKYAVSPAPGAADLPFTGGAVGWLAYDLGRQFEDVHDAPADDLRAPDIRLAWHDTALVWDHEKNLVWVVGIDGQRPAREAMQELTGWLDAPPLSLSETRDAPTGLARSDLTRDEYVARVEQIRAGIAGGEYYQLNLVQRFACAHAEAAAQTYLRLRAKNPAPFAAFIDADEFAILSSSPERFLEVTPDGWMRTCPIKGTRPRGASPAEDDALRDELLGSAKERAELLMIVDLLRNDFGRVCVPGTVNVARLHALESFATVHHLVGEVRGKLRPGLTRRELLRAVFPGGSITGAPKVSAMRAIDRLEPHRRGIAMGSIGYFSAHGRIDLNIAIRTIVSTGGRAYVPVGAGIVWDSDPANEFAETLAKAQALFVALGVTPIET